MFKLKSLTQAIFLTVLLVMTGCSDEIISPLSQSSGQRQLTTADERNTDTKALYRKVSLKPHQTIEFNAGNTIFSSFNSISILNCGISKSRLEILGYANDAILLLGCNSRDFFAYSITIENKSSAEVELDVFLNGLRKIEIGPVTNNDKELF